MDNTPSFDTILAFLENKPSAWKTVKPLIKLVLLIAPGIVTGSIGIAVETVKPLLDSLDTLLDRIEETITGLAPYVRKQASDPEADLEKLQIANVLLVFASYFDTLRRNNPILWDTLQINAHETQYLAEQALVDHHDVSMLIGSDGHGILPQRSERTVALEQFYALLNARVCSFSKGLEKTEFLRADWAAYPQLATEHYRTQLVMLCQKSEKFRVWVGIDTADALFSYVNQLTQGQDQIKSLLFTLVNNTKMKQKNTSLRLPLGATLGLEAFVGRTQEMAELSASIHQRVKPIFVTGLGGIGKTELVRRFAQQYTAGEVFWVTFTDSFRDTIIRGIAAGVSNLQKNMSTDEIYEIVMNHLHQCDKDDLLIIDNVDSEVCTLRNLLLDSAYEDLCGLNMNIIITTRYRNPNGLKLGKLRNSELYQIFNKYDVCLNLEEMDALINAVDGHTMTIDLIARTLEESHHKITPGIILDTLTKGELSDSSFPEVETDHDREQQRINSHLHSLFGLSGISEAGLKVLRWAVLMPQSGLNSLEFQNGLAFSNQYALAELVRKGWIRREDYQYSMHPVIRLVCRKELNPTDDTCEGFLNRIWISLDHNHYDQQSISRIAELFSRASDELEDKNGTWASHASNYWAKLGLDQKALFYKMRVLDRCKNIAPTDFIKLAKIHREVGEILNRLGKLDSALDHQKQAISLIEEGVSVDDSELTLIYNSIGMTYTSLGKLSTALEYKLKALVIEESRPLDKRNHSLLASLYSNIGYTYDLLEDRRNALVYKKKALEISKEFLNEDHPTLAVCYDNVGVTYSLLGEHAKALNYKLMALAIRERILPKTHHELAVSYNNIGLSYGKIGDHTASLEYLSKAIAIQKTILPADHPNLASYYNNIANAYLELGDVTKSLDYHMQALEIRKKVLPKNHPDLALTFSNIAGLYAKIEKYQEALEYMSSAVTTLENSLSPTHPKLISYREHARKMELLALLQSVGVDIINPYG